MEKEARTPYEKKSSWHKEPQQPATSKNQNRPTRRQILNDQEKMITCGSYKLKPTTNAQKATKGKPKRGTSHAAPDFSHGSTYKRNEITAKHATQISGKQNRSPTKRKFWKGGRQATLEGKEAKTTTRRALATLIIILIMATAPALTTAATTSNQSQQNNKLNSTIREGAPATSLYWAKTFGGSNDDFAYSVQQTTDGGYIVAGKTDSFRAGGWDYWVLKLNSTGGVTWQKTYGGTGDDEAYSVQQTSDGGYIVAGWTTSFGAGASDAWILKLNSTGDVTWQKTYGGTGNDYAYSIQQTSDGGYIVAGATNSFGAGEWDFWVLKLNSTGGVTWQKTYGGTNSDLAESVQQTSDGGYIVAGMTRSFGGGSYDIWVLKLNSTGGVSWQKTYGGTGDDEAYSVQQTSDGGYIVAGSTNSFGAGGYDFWVLKLNSTGGVTWQKTYGGTSNEFARSVRQTSDEGYIVVGGTSSFGAGGVDIWVLKLNSTGGVSWQKTYGGTGDDMAYSVQQTSDGGYILPGTTNSFGAGGYDIWVLKLNSTGSIVFDGGIGASTTTTNVVPSNTSATVTTTSVTGTNSTATVQNTAVTPQDTHATVMVQSPDITPPATINDLAAGSPTNTSITLTWTAPGDSGMKGNATGYVVKYSTSGAITASNWSSATTYTQTWMPAKNGTTETHAVTGLTPGTKYWFAVEAYDKVPNYGGVSNSPNAITTAPTPPPSPGIPAIIIVGAVAVIVLVVIIVAVVLVKRKKPS
jgi:uncharacterized delta-60 repeat protein